MRCRRALGTPPVLNLLDGTRTLPGLSGAHKIGPANVRQQGHWSERPIFDKHGPDHTWAKRGVIDQLDPAQAFLRT